MQGDLQLFYGEINVQKNHAFASNGFPQSLTIWADVAHLGAVSEKYLYHHLVRALEAKIRSQREKLID